MSLLSLVFSEKSRYPFQNQIEMSLSSGGFLREIGMSLSSGGFLREIGMSLSSGVFSQGN